MSEPFAIASPTLGEEIRGHVVQTAADPVALVYLLHGRSGAAEDWLPVLAGLALPPLVAVLLDAPWSERASWYVDSAAADGKAVESAIVRDVVPAFDARFPALADRDRRLLAGVSMGGAGALRIVLAYPELFGALISLSPAIYVPPPPPGSSLRKHGAFGRPDSQFNLPTYRALHYRRLLRNAPGLRAFVAVGGSNDLADEAATVASDLAGAGARVESHRYPGGHGWETWGPALGDGVRALLTPGSARA
jgi:enterochelin esterase-like enzyme